jgi:hypothetical protein
VLPADTGLARSANKAWLVPAVLGLVLVAGGGAAAWWLLGGPSAQARSAPALPQRAAGAIREFPVDNDPSAPVRPTSVIRRNLAAGATGQQVPDTWLPPGLPPQDLPQVAQAITSASLRAADDGPAVPVHVLETSPEDRSVARRIADRVEKAAGTGARTTGVEVTSPDGDVYEGVRVQTPETETFVLANRSQPIVIVIYAGAAALFPIAERLAANVSNGEGLPDYPEYTRTLGVLPARPPADLVLDEMTTYRPEDLGIGADQLAAKLGSDAPPELTSLVSWLRRFMPARITTARYRNPAGGAVDVLAGDYSSGLRAMTTWLALRALGAANTFDTLDSALGTGLWASTAEGPVLIVRTGTVLMGFRGPVRSDVQALVPLAESMQPAGNPPR